MAQVASGTRSGGYEMAPLDAHGREPGQQSNNLDASALERGGGGGGGGDGVDDERPGDVPSVLQRKAKTSFGAINLPQAMCGFICGVIITLIIAALARSPIDQSAPPSLCEPADLVTTNDPPISPPAPVLLAANAMAALTAIEGDLKKLVQYIVSGPGRGDAYNRTAKFVDEFGHRHSCSESLKMSLEELKRTLEAEFGEKNVKKFPVPNVPKWVRGKEACTLLSPPLRQGTVPALNRSIEILGLGFSVGTNNSVLEAPVVVVGSLDELVEKRELVRGKIVVFDMPYQGYGKTRPYRTHCASFCAKFGARALLLRSITPWSLKTPHTGALTYRQDLRPDLRTLDRKTADGLGFGKGGVPDELLGDYSSVAKIPAAAITLEDAAMLRRMTAREPEDPVVVRLEMEARTEGTCTSHNMIAEVRGSEKPDEVVVVSGHWDSWDVGQGAMDDAGPAFTALQTIRAARALGLSPKRTIRMIFWTAEEIGSLGGKAYFDANSELPVEKLAVAIELDFGVFNPTGINLRADEQTTNVAKWVGAKVLPKP